MHPRTRLIGGVTLGAALVAVALAESGVAPRLEPTSVVAAYLVLAFAGSLIDRSRHRRATVFLAAVVVGLVAVLVAWVVATLDLSTGLCGAPTLDPACATRTLLQTAGLRTLAWIAPLGALFALGAAGTRWGRRAVAVGLVAVMLVSLVATTGYPTVSVEALWVGVIRTFVALALGLGALVYGRAVGLSAAA